ncbi:MAG: beta-Ala-His dipeptidase [Coprobacillus sp.]
MSVLDTKKPVFYYFEKISEIPHGSYHEEALSQYVEQLAIENKLRYVKDEMHNIIVYKDATKGYETHEPVMLQAHLDMVNEKNNDSQHDFDNDGLSLDIREGFVFAHGTTLGADDAYGVSYMLAILTDNSLSHPPLECVFTVQEEVGLCGAMALDVSGIKSKRMIGLDSDTEGITCTSSSGGRDVKIVKPVMGEDNNSPIYVIEIKGLKGGHSGECIDKGRSNANKLMARVLYQLLVNGIDVRLVDIDGGLKNNAIPRECVAAFASSSDQDDIYSIIDRVYNEIKTEIYINEDSFEMSYRIDECDICICSKDSEAIITIMFLAINGVMDKSQVIENLTTASLNMGVVKTHDDCIIIDYSLRSPLESVRNHLSLQLKTVVQLFNGYVEESSDYPGWDYNPDSLFRKQLREFYKQQTNQDIKEVATHAGLETGVFKGKISDMDIITLGPNIKDLHTPQERMDIDSFENVYNFLVEFLKVL